MTPLPLALIGDPTVCRTYLPLLSGDPAINLVALDPGGVEAQLVSPEVEAVVIAGAGEPHAAWAEQASRAGKHVLCDYPLGATREACRTIMGAAAVGGATFMIGARARYARLIGFLKEGLTARESPRTLQLQVVATGPCDGPALRAFDLACTLIEGEPVSVYAVGRTVTIGFSDRSTATVLLMGDAFQKGVEPYLALYDDGCRMALSGWQHLHVAGPDPIGAGETSLSDPDDGAAGMLEAFVRLVRGDHTPGADIREAMRSSVIGFLAEESVEAHGVALPISRKDYVIGAVSC
ncbi:MAG: Gfo/Idh/MocA family oxidoreductase [Lentisphaerae bacterium]|nr:Gfo/Idh/MocA family oxidoreductase [Lentisphaerota bacterium]